MKIGIEEEFIVVDSDTLFHTPSAFRLATNLSYNDFTRFMKWSVELPLNSGNILSILKNLKKGFSIIEIKTEPHEEIELLRNELLQLRNELLKVAIRNNLLILPCGLHPFYSPKNSFLDNCAALHIHIDYKTGVLKRIRSIIPFLISISTNSPFINGKVAAKSNRIKFSQHINNLKNQSKRSVDILHNEKLNTIEIRILDSQITVDESIGLASIAKIVAESDNFNNLSINDKDYIRDREIAGNNGYGSIKISDKLYEKLLGYNYYSKYIIEEENGSDWQIKIFEKFGLSSVVFSLWDSFNKNKRVISKTKSKIYADNISFFPLFYIIPYAPFLLLEKYKKYKQDITGFNKILNNMIN